MGLSFIKTLKHQLTMKQLLSLTLIASVALVISSCNQDNIGDLTITYMEGTAIYGDMETVRQQPILGSAIPVVNPGKIFVSPNYLFIGEEGKGIHVYDNRTPSNPANIAFLNIPGNREFFFKDDFLYAESYYDMVKIDLSNPMQPVEVGRAENSITETITDYQGRTLLGFDFEEVTKKVEEGDDVYNYLYNNEDSYVLYDYANNLIPPSAVPASFAGNSNNNIGSVNRVTHHDDHVYVVSRSSLVVYEDKGDFQLLNRLPMGWDMETVYPMGDKLFIGARSSVEIVNISVPSEPYTESSFWHATSCDPVLPVSGTTAYVTLRTGDFSECPGDESALIVLDVTGNWGATAVQTINMESPYGLTKIGDELFVGEGANGLKIFDASNERNLKLKKFEEGFAAYDVLPHPSNDRILLIAGPNGLSQYRISEEFDLVSKVY